MQLILAPRVPNDAPLPDAAQLALGRDLHARFPQALLRELALVRARELDERADPTGATRVWLALESLQVTGSFKVRGALVAIAAIKDAAARSGSKAPHVVAASAGNHGAGVAYAARVLGVRATIVVPSSVPRAKRDRIVAYGAEVRLGPTTHYDDAESLAIELASREGARFLSPYDDMDVLIGNGSSLGYEIARALGAVPRALVAPLGGGGLASGIACAFADVARESLGDVRRVWGAQSEACPAMARSLEAGAAIERMGAPEGTLAEALEGGISARGFARAAASIAGVGVVSERAIGEAIAYAVRELGVVIEGGSACALAVTLASLPVAMRGGDFVVLLSGRNIDKESIEHALAL
jgi:threonine dehydratase